MPAGAIESPCIKVCTMDEATGWCLGCGRSLREIAAWGSITAETRRAVMAQLEGRLARIENRSARIARFRPPQP